MGEIVYLYNCRHLRNSVLHLEGLLGNRWVLVATAVLPVFQLMFTYLPPMQALFGTAGLDPATWARIVAFGIVLFLVVELEKRVLGRFGRGRTG
jgi:magnesium-transporting ATPase (P-type)